MKRLKLILGVLLAAGILSVAPFAHATDIAIYPTGPVYRLTGLVWGTSTVPGFNNNYFFTPLNLNESVCVYVRNNNPTSSHTFTASIVITSDPSNTTPSDGTWQAAASSANISAAISPGLGGGIGASVSGVSQVSINLSASTVQAGSPDTANVSIVQTSGNCFSGNQFIGSAPQTVNSVEPIQTISEGLSQSFSLNAVGNGVPVNNINAEVNANSGARTIYMARVNISSTVTQTLQIIQVATTGTGCGGGGAINLKFGSPVTSTSLTASTCTVQPTFGSVIYNFNILANTNVILDLSGVILTGGTTQGIAVLTSLNTGVVNTQFFWYEK